MANNINHLIDAYRCLKKDPTDIVLATIVETFGSSYQKAGAKMLIARDGELTGLLGGGCFEKDLMEQAWSVFETGQSKTVFYDMRSPDDVIWGLGLGCNGAVRVLLQLLKIEDRFHPLNAIFDAAEANVTGILVTSFESEHPDFRVGYSIFQRSDTIDSKPSLVSDPFPLQTSAYQAILQGKPHIEAHFIESHIIKVFYDLIQPPSQLLVLGAGVDTVPVVQYAKALGWRITVVDHRPDYIKQDRFPQADNLLNIIPQDLSEKLELDQFNAIVLMTHSIEYDERYLKIIANSNIPFIGLLGPTQRKDRLLHSLGTASAHIKDKVFGPVGLDIGAETPAEIALSIMAGIHAAINGRNGGQLNSNPPHVCID
jgi:xanthine/CO dehydrogenase XdhC/CoxF family maturation factor